MRGANAYGEVKIKAGAWQPRAIQPFVCPMGRCAVLGEALAFGGALGVRDFRAGVIFA
jgi:hypothetical protein